MAILLIVSFVVTSWTLSVQGQSQCRTPQGLNGECIAVTNCPHLLAIVNKNSRTPQELDFLRKSHCGYQGSTPKVCCGDSSTPATTLPPPPPPPPPPPTSTSSCSTPDGQAGRCISLYSCPQLVSLLSKKPVMQDTLAFVQNSRCSGPEQYSVCCANAAATVGTEVTEAPQTGECRSTALLPNPRTECCGRDAASGNKITGGNATGVDQYPWLAIIEYKKDNKIKILCGGVLISGRYTLTAGHCVSGTVLDYGTPANVRLGEYDTSNEGEDCVPAEGGGMDCTEGIVVIPIEKIIHHPDYNPYNSLRRNDIALIRMRNMAPYTDFIRPICLPSTDVTVSPPAEFTLYAAGWGAVNETVSASSTKLHVDLPFVSRQDCQPAYNVVRRKIPLWERQICAGGIKGKDSCKGDSGGPLMYENGRTYEVLGIVSFGPSPCGLKNIPGVYTKVYEYNSWIRREVKV